jgi:hypothetical protein
MGPSTSLSAPQRRAVLGADSSTGEVKAGATICESLAVKQVAVGHGRRGAYYLTALGHSLRAELIRAADALASSPTSEPSEQFAARTGAETELSAVELDDHRAAQVAQAWASLLEIRRLTSPDGGASGPAPWERHQPISAVALALEAGGAPSCVRSDTGRYLRSGYLVSQGEQAASVRVDWRAIGRDVGKAEDSLNDCTVLLAAAGWDALLYRGEQGRRFLLVHPTG